MFLPKFSKITKPGATNWQLTPPFLSKSQVNSKAARCNSKLWTLIQDAQ